jgi:hypothetical protein
VKKKDGRENKKKKENATGSDVSEFRETGRGRAVMDTKRL